jgi:hypothetical protein
MSRWRRVHPPSLARAARALPSASRTRAHRPVARFTECASAGALVPAAKGGEGIASTRTRYPWLLTAGVAVTCVSATGVGCWSQGTLALAVLCSGGFPIRIGTETRHPALPHCPRDRIKLIPCTWWVPLPLSRRPRCARSVSAPDSGCRPYAAGGGPNETASWDRNGRTLHVSCVQLLLRPRDRGVYRPPKLRPLQRGRAPVLLLRNVRIRGVRRPCLGDRRHLHRAQGLQDQYDS